MKTLMAVDTHIAKSARPGGVAPPTVAEHGRQTAAAFDAIWNSVADALAESRGIPRHRLNERIYVVARCAALLHDLGKLNSSFQRVVRTPGDGIRQPVRHEILSAMAISDASLGGDWFRTMLGEERAWMLAWAVGGHHLQLAIDPTGKESLLRQGKIDPAIRFFLADAQARDLLDDTRETLQRTSTRTSPPSPLMEDVQWSTLEDASDSVDEPLRRFVNDSIGAWRRMGRDGELLMDLAVIKALAIAADVAASALVAREEALDSWIPRALDSRVTPADLQPVIDANLDGRPLRPFQSGVANSPKRVTVVIAGTGNGKTTAAYLWGQRWAAGRKLFFTYPTTGTASAGYQDYLLEQPELKRTLMHGRALVDLEAMDATSEQAQQETGARIEALTAWGHQVIACTVDTVLGLMQNNRRPLFSFPPIAAGAFVFDEIHSYDRKLFGELLRFLEVLPGVPALLMSASIPPSRLARLREVVGDRLGAPITGDETLEKLERYRIDAVASDERCWPFVADTLGRGDKVLWVCNTVGDACRVYREAIDRRVHEMASVTVYHSRFRYRDRVARQTHLVGQFRPGARKAVLAIATQVCEMSLDISADLLVMARAPLTALVQRLGRLNRYAVTDDPKTCLVYPFQGRPYDSDEDRAAMIAADEAIRQLAGRAVSQRDLALALDRMVFGEDIDTHSAWVDGGWQSESAAARIGDESITLIREEDLPEIEHSLGQSSRRWSSSRLVPWTIPMRYRSGIRFAGEAGAYSIAAEGQISYNWMTGGAWAS